MIPDRKDPSVTDDLTLDVRDDEVVLRAGDVDLGHYVFAPDAPAAEAPKPYWHPLRALDGGLVTGLSPVGPPLAQGPSDDLDERVGCEFLGRTHLCRR